MVGSGAAGMSAALAAGLRGLTVVVVEGAEHYGGTTAYSGGAVWIPGSGRGAPDAAADGEAYLAALTGDHVDARLRAAFVRAAPAMVDEYEARTRWVRFDPITILDYRPETVGGRPEGRALEARMLDGSALGSDRAGLRPPSPATDLKGMPITSADFIDLSMIARTGAGWRSAARVLGRLVAARARRERPLALGQALVARLRLALRDLDVPVLLGRPMVGLVVDDGRVVGVRLSDGEVTARRGVVLATGGFSRNQELREKYLPAPTSAAWSLAPPDGQDGAGVLAGMAAGGATDLMDRVWGMPTALVAKAGQQDVPLMLLTERALPGTLVVDAGGGRFANEALPYAEFWDAMYSASAVPAWLVFDRRAKNRYAFLTVPPRLPFPRSWYAKGYVHRAPTLGDLAAEIGTSALVRTVAEFNTAIRAGAPDRWHRGASAYDRYYGDPTLAAPNLQPLDRGPFYAVPVYPGDLGTSGGLVVDQHSRVRRPDGSVIAGLYAAGNCSAGVMGRTYPGPGATISAAMVAGYLAARHVSAS